MEYVNICRIFTVQLKIRDMKTKLIETTRTLQGCKIETSIDRIKRSSNRLTSICGKYYIIITPENELIELVGKRVFDKWAKLNDYVTDF